MAHVQDCSSCQCSGTLPTDYGPVDCPDCGGAGYLPPRSVLTEWRARDIERGLATARAPDASDARWLLAELRQAREALTSIIALAHDVQDPDAIAMRIRFIANQGLGLYAIADDRTATSPTP